MGIKQERDTSWERFLGYRPNIGLSIPWKKLKQYYGITKKDNMQEASGIRAEYIHAYYFCYYEFPKIKKIQQTSIEYDSKIKRDIDTAFRNLKFNRKYAYSFWSISMFGLYIILSILTMWKMHPIIIISMIIILIILNILVQIFHVF